MQKYFTSIFTNKKGYGLSQYNVKYTHKKMTYEWNNEQSETRRMGKRNNIHAEQSEAGNFFEKI